MLLPAGAAFTLLLGVLFAHLAAWRWHQGQLYASELMGVRQGAWAAAVESRQRTGSRLVMRPKTTLSRVPPRLHYVPSAPRHVKVPPRVTAPAVPTRTERVMDRLSRTSEWMVSSAETWADGRATRAAGRSPARH